MFCTLKWVVTLKMPCTIPLIHFCYPGAIELSILSKHYQTEIAVADIETGRVDRFGKDHSFSLLSNPAHWDVSFIICTPPPPPPPWRAYCDLVRLAPIRISIFFFLP